MLHSLSCEADSYSAGQDTERRLWNHNVHHSHHKRPPLDTMPSHLNSDHILKHIFFMAHFKNHSSIYAYVC
jgi:hypothetical protein